VPTFFQIKTFLSYWLEAVDEHSLHSPFFFDFQRNVVKHKSEKSYAEFEGLRAKLKNDKREITVQDLGAGSRYHSSSKRKISEIASTSLSPSKYASLYNRLINNYKAKNIVELGTSLGINTLYLSDNDDTKVITFEGVPEIAEIARTTFEFAKAKNIKLIEGEIDTTLPAFLNTASKIDFVFIDANHRYDPTLKYFEWLLRKIHPQSIIAIDDIHYSPEMEKAWHALKLNTMVYGSVDLYRCGILFFDPSLNKQHVVLQF
jgi:predicted O-methyltransferase YrrM